MKKSYLRSLAVLGITGSVILTAQELSALNSSNAPSEQMQCGCRGGYIRQPSTQKTNPDKYGSNRKKNNDFTAMNESSDEGTDATSDEGETPSSSNSQYPSRYSPQMNSNPSTSTNTNQTNTQNPNKQTAYRYGSRTIASADENAPKNVEAESEEQLLKQLDVEGKRIYNSLSPEGKQLAQRLAKQYADKNQAVKHAQKQMSGMAPASKEMEK